VKNGEAFIQARFLLNPHLQEDPKRVIRSKIREKIVGNTLQATRAKDGRRDAFVNFSAIRVRKRYIDASSRLIAIMFTRDASYAFNLQPC
jgi:hypothetical protein